MNQPIIAFIGGGNMAASLIGGLVETGYPATSILVSEPVAAARDKLHATYGVAVTADNNDVCRRADLIVLAVKPQVLKAVAQGIAEALSHNPLIVSIAAGIPATALQHWLGSDKPIVRCMPNTPALVHLGATGLFATPAVSATHRAQVEALFKAVGMSAWVNKEEDIDAVTALSGSGPAYFFLLIEAMEQAGVALGLSPEVSRQLTLQTALGSATMAANSDVDCTELRRRVTSPGGTTEKAIATFLAGQLPELVAQAMAAASQRAQEMADEFSR